MKFEPARVVITGIGVLACNGLGRQAFWDAIWRGKSGIGPLDRFDASELPCRIAGQLWDFNPNDFMNKGDVRRWHRPVHQAVAAAKLAIEDAELDGAGYDPERIAVGVGTSVGSLDETYEDYKRVYAEKGWKDVERLASSATSGHSATANVSTKFGLRGPAITIGSGCATGLDIVSWGRQQIRAGLADAAVVGATEAPINGMTFAASCSLGILSDCNDVPEKAMRPFDKSSDSLVLSEAAVVVVLERLDRARARGAQIFGEVAGTGASAEGHNPVVLERDGAALSRAIEAALREAGMIAAEIDAVHSHGVGLTMYDRSETCALKRSLGDHAYRVPITATKSMIGQAYATGGLLSVAGACFSLETGIMPPTINLEDPDPQCDLDYVPLTPRMNDINSVLVNALSFGGTHSATVLRQPN